MGGDDEHPERIDKKCCEEPDSGDDQLRPEKLVDADGESEHEIALVSEEVLVEAPDGEFKYRVLDIKRQEL